jgi:hypothetical protein
LAGGEGARASGGASGRRRGLRGPRPMAPHNIPLGARGAFRGAPERGGRANGWHSYPLGAPERRMAAPWGAYGRGAAADGRPPSEGIARIPSEGGPGGKPRGARSRSPSASSYLRLPSPTCACRGLLWPRRARRLSRRTRTAPTRRIPSACLLSSVRGRLRAPHRRPDPPVSHSATNPKNTIAKHMSNPIAHHLLSGRAAPALSSAPARLPVRRRLGERGALERHASVGDPALGDHLGVLLRFDRERLPAG